MSNADRQKRYRDMKRNAQQADTVTRVTTGHTVTRTNPDLINHGKPMTAHQLDRAGLKANYAPIPGDSDYSGVCEQVGGVWQVRAA
jgi:hypothetical protein